MARQKFEKSFNTFVKGLMTEASELNFPENYSLYEKNFDLRRDGGRDRRRGMELLYPLGVTLTSTPYPIESEDALGVSSSVDSTLFRQAVRGYGGVPESVPVAATVSGLSFRTTLIELPETESAALSSSVSRIKFREALVEAGFDGRVELSALVSGVSFNRVVVDSAIESDRAAIGAAVVGVNFYED